MDRRKQQQSMVSQNDQITVEELEETGRLRLVAFCGDNASVNIASAKLLVGEKVETYKDLDKQTLDYLNFKRPIPMLNCACHSLDLALGDYVSKFKIKEKLKRACDAFNVRFDYCPTRWFSLYTNMREVCNIDKANTYDLNVHMKITKLISDAIGELERNGCSQEQARNIMIWLKQDLRDLKNKMSEKTLDQAKKMIKIIEERETKHFGNHYEIAEYNRLLKHDTQCTYAELEASCIKMKDMFGVYSNCKHIWEYKHAQVPQSTLEEPLSYQYANVCAQTAYMCSILEALVVGEAEIERSFSFLRRQLDYTRSRLSPSTLEKLLYIRIHDNMDYNKQIEEFNEFQDEEVE
ncbi:Conserved_hypothetical protein [Hexamita inflata]|uniref:Uncharacterized protein n=1 Tax=Hexamita inflata TaxID=28002 RepID=A0AA86UW38_9EUKA|nr:Conserved hypothetical protein [Hexamita inflata]